MGAWLRILLRRRVLKRLYSHFQQADRLLVAHNQEVEKEGNESAKEQDGSSAVIIAAIIALMYGLKTALQATDWASLIGGIDPSRDSGAQTTGALSKPPMFTTNVVRQGLFTPPADSIPIDPSAALDHRNATAIGVRKHNLLNYRSSKSAWEGKVGMYTHKGDMPAGEYYGGFTEFADPYYGIRAAAKTIEKYPTVYPNDVPELTITTLVGKFAPSTENDTAIYISNVSRLSGIDPNTPITLKDKDTFVRIIGAMIRQEVGTVANPEYLELCHEAIFNGGAIPLMDYGAATPPTIGVATKPTNNLIALNMDNNNQR